MTLLAVALVVVGALSIGVAGAGTPTPRPTSLTATATSASAITLHWTDASTNERGFEVQRSLAYPTAYKTITVAAVNATSYADSGLNAATSYKYRVRALKPTSGASSFSTVATATTFGGTTDTTKPSVPSGLSGTASSCSQINLTWNASTDNAGGSGLAKYNLYRNNAFLKSITAPATSTSDIGLTALTSYSYAITAVDNANNESVKSTSVNAATPSCGGVTLPVPGGFKASATSCAFAIASWNPIFDPNNTYGIVKYNLYRNGALAKIVNAPATSVIDTNLTAGSTYSYAVTAVDAANHESAKTAPVTTVAPACPPAGAWARTYGDVGGERSSAVAVDGAGNIVVGGMFVGTADFGGGPVTASPHGDIFIAKYSPTHALLWVNHYASSYTTSNEVYGIAADAAGNVFVAGAFFGTINVGGANLVNGQVGYRDGFVAKYSAAGVHQWSRRFGGTKDDLAFSVALDTAGNPVFAGYFHDQNVDFGGKTMSSGIFGGNSSFVVKYASATGANLLGFVTPCGSDNAYGVAVDSANNIIITGSLSVTCNFGGGQLLQNNTDIYVAKYSPSGSYLWARAFGGRFPDQGNAVAVDGNGNVIVTGMFADAVDFGNGSLGAPHLNPWAFLVKLAANNGSSVWSKAFGDGYTAYGYGVAADAQGNVTVTGAFQGTIDFGGGPLTTPVVNGFSGHNAFVAQYSAAGAHLASNRYGEAGNSSAGNTQGYAVASSATGAIVTGAFTDSIDLGFGPTASAGRSDFYILNTGR